MAERVHILHVDDDQAYADLAATFLEQECSRFDVDTATGGREALERLDDTGYDCVVSDHDMPGLSGIELLETVRETHQELPFFLFTGKGSEEVASEAISAGVTDYLQKGGGSEQYALLANRIDNAVSAQRTARQAARQAHQLREQRRFVEQALDALDELFYVVGYDWTLERWNNRLREVSGYTDDRLNGMSVTDLVAEPDHERLHGALEAALTNGRATVAVDLRTADGEQVPYEFTGSRLTDGDGEPIGVTGVGRRRSGHGLPADAAGTVARNTTNPAVFVDLTGAPSIEWTNSAYEQLVGHDTARLHGSRPTAVFDGDRGERTEIRYRDCAEQQTAQTYTESWTVDRESRTLKTTLTPITRAETVVALVEVKRDITGHVHRTAALDRHG